MNIFLDTSSLFKLYHNEFDSQSIDKIFSTITVKNIYLSLLSKLEFSSTVWKKVRKKEISEDEAISIIETFELDFEKYIFISINSKVLTKAVNLISNYGLTGLRTLDSIQLATSISLRDDVDYFFTSDILLKSLLEKEGLQTEI